MNSRSSTWPNLRRLPVRAALLAVLLSTLLPYVTTGQATQSQANQLTASIANVVSGNFVDVDIKTIAKFGAAQQVLPALEQQFASPADKSRQGILASALVRLGARDNTYWDFLLAQATLAVESDVPFPVQVSDGNVIDHELSPEIIAWAQAHHVDANTAGQSALYDLPGKVLLLGVTGDSRGIPLLRRALQSINPMIVVMAAKGLAHLQDKDSIPLIIEACRRAPKGFGAGIAEASLIFFDDPPAQAAVDTYVPKDRAKVWRDARAHGLWPFGY